MKFINRIKNNILDNSIKKNLLGVYSIVIILMSFLFITMLFYSIDLNNTYNKIMLNIENYNKINSQIDSINKNIYLDITEQKPFDGKNYAKNIIKINEELVEIGNNFDERKNITAIASVEILKRTVKKLDTSIAEIDFLIKTNSNYASRENMLILTTHIKEIIKSNIQELMTFNLTQSQKHINTIKNSYNIALILIIILFCISILASVIFLLFVIKDTINKINLISSHANKLANGDLSIEHIKFSDANEFQVLALSFNKMKNNIKDYISQLSSSKMRITSILNALNDCIITTSSNGEIESCNNAIEQIFMYRENEMVGRNIKELINAIDFSRYKQDKFNAQKLIKNVKNIDNKYQLEGTKKDGTTIPIELSYNEVEFEGQRVTTFIIHDITQHKNVEKMKDEFISIISHELRTPLTSIKGALGLVNAGVLGLIPNKANDVLKIADNNCSRLSNLINDILDLEKIKAGKMNFEFNSYNIISIVEESIEASLEYAKQYDVKYEMIDSIESAKVNVDKNRLIQVLLNLLSNAAKFSHAHSTVNIKVERINDELVRVKIQDTGVGISEEFKSQIYNNFSQEDSSDARKKGGTGLGLSISKEIISIMGGKISFESKLNEGTSFYIDLPKKKD